MQIDFSDIKRNISYIYTIDNIDYLSDRRKIYKKLDVFMTKCEQFNIYIYDIINDKYHIHTKGYILWQILKTKSQMIDIHISELKKIQNTNCITMKIYVNANNRITNIIRRIIHDLDILENICEYVYENDLLNIQLNRIIHVDMTEIKDEMFLSHLSEIPKRENYLIKLDDSDMFIDVYK